MTAASALLLALTAVVAAFDWLAVATDRRRVEYVLKPLTMVGLMAVALTMDPSDDVVRVAVIAALVLSLAGDVFLMLPANLFVPGLVSFLGAHLAYVVAMVAVGVLGGWLVVGLLVVGVGVAVVGVRILRGARAHDRALTGPVAAYLAVISLMVVGAAGTGRWVVVAGALLFYVSDAVLGWTRFVADVARGRLVVMVTYHLGQGLLVLGLL